MSKSKPTICFVTPFFYPVLGGVETHIFETAKQLIEKGWKVYVITSDSDRRGKVKSRSKENYNGINIVRCSTISRISFGEVLFPSAVKELKNINPNIVHIHGFRHWYNIIPFLIKSPCFITPHWPDYKGQRPFLIQLIANLIDLTIGKSLMNANKRICVVTEDEISWVNHFKINTNKTLLTPNALPQSLLSKKSPNLFKKKFKLSNEKIILSVSRLHKSKGIDLLIKSAKNLPEYKFVILGKDGGAEKELKQLARDLKVNNVIFGGEVSESIKNSAYSAADLYVSASHFEAFGITLLEAMSQETPCIVSRKGGMPWVVSDTGLTFQEDNLSELTENIKKLMTNDSLRAELGKKAMNRAKKFTWEKTAEILNKEYKKFI